MQTLPSETFFSYTLTINGSARGLFIAELSPQISERLGKIPTPIEVDIVVDDSSREFETTFVKQTITQRYGIDLNSIHCMYLDDGYVWSTRIYEPDLEANYIKYSDLTLNHEGRSESGCNLYVQKTQQENVSFYVELNLFEPFNPSHLKLHCEVYEDLAILKEITYRNVSLSFTTNRDSRPAFSQQWVYSED